LGVAATLAANILHGIERGALAAALAAWPAIALVISYELIMWVVRSGRELADRAHGAGLPERALAGPAPATVAPAQAARAPRVGPVVDAFAPVTEAAQVDWGEPARAGDERRVAFAEPELAAAVRAGDDGQAGEGQGDSDRRARVAALLAQDPSMTGTALARALGVHETTGRKYRREALNGNGHSA
jgi:hypothetical protein